MEKIYGILLWPRGGSPIRVNRHKLIVFTYFQANITNNSSSSPTKGAKPKKRTIKGGINVEDTKEGHGPEALHGKTVGNIYHYWRAISYSYCPFLESCHKHSNILNFCLIGWYNPSVHFTLSKLCTLLNSHLSQTHPILNFPHTIKCTITPHCLTICMSLSHFCGETHLP